MTMKLTRFIRAMPILSALAIAGAMVAPKPAEARIGVGVFVGPSVVVGPPVYGFYYPVPVYYPRPVYFYPPVPAPAPAGYTCYAGPYVCPLDKANPVGGPCACPSYGGASVAGTVR
jgi:hypothetical protein